MYEKNFQYKQKTALFIREELFYFMKEKVTSNSCTSLYVFTVCIQISLVLVFAFVDWTTNQNCVFILVRTIIVRFSTIYKFFRCVSKKFIVANQESTLSFINKRQSFR